MAWTCPGCEAKNKARAVECENCGIERPIRGTTPAGQFPASCWYDGGRLDAQGYCPQREGFPVGVRCSFFCPLCRQRLEWSGACSHCQGTNTRLEDWTFPGDRYETHDEFGKPIGDGQHWVLIAKGLRPACSPQTNAQEAKMLARVLGVFEDHATALKI